jgi:GMP synthase (glutamine-hydrolysing)
VAAFSEAMPTDITELPPQRAQGAVLGLDSRSEEALKRMFEDLGADMQLLPYTTSASELEHLDFVVGSGGGNSVHDSDAPKFDPAIYSPDFKPLVIGVCLTAQTLVYEAGGEVIEAGGDGETSSYGPLKVDVIDQRADGGFAKLDTAEMVHSNGDHFKLSGLPPGFVPTSMTGDHVASYVDTNTGNVGIQFHPELSGALGYGVVRNILQARNINLQPIPKDLFAAMVKEIEENTGEDDLVIGYSGGVDSRMVVDAALASKVPRERIHIVHLDLGTNRTVNGVPESDIIMDNFEEHYGFRPHFRRLSPEKVFHTPVEVFDKDKQSLGFRVLGEQTNSEEKRLAFSQIYGTAFDDLIKDLGLNPDKTKIVQGTLYPDVAESIGKGRVKTHHNMGPFFQFLMANGRVISPAQRYFKQDMRDMGKARGFKKDEYDRQPFPGPGIIPRVICYDGELILPENPDEQFERIKTIVGDEYGVVLGGFNTVGSGGDKRSLAWPVFLTGEPDWEFFKHMAVRLGNEMPKVVNRLYYLTGDRIESINTHDVMTRTLINEESVGQVQLLDDRVNRVLEAFGALDLSITDQVPIGTMPTAFHKSNGGRTAFFRPFRTPKTASFLNGEAVSPEDEPVLKEAWPEVEKVAMSVDGIERVAYDMMGKPNGSTEAE